MSTDAPEIALTGRWVADAVGGHVVGDPRLTLAGVSIDTRTLAPGELFIAIRGERHDGADFAQAALAAGAGGLLLPRGGAGRVGGAAATVIEVDDTTVALQSLAHAVRAASGSRVVAITGSAGKTTTKEVSAEFLAARYRVIRNRGNLNNHIGLPLSLIELRRRPEIAVVELGMNHAGEISTLVRIAEPDLRVWTNVGDAHAGFFASVDALADAKAEILEGATADTVLVANADDEQISRRRSGFRGRVVTFGIEHEADVRATSIVDRGADGSSADVSTPRGSAALTISLAGRGNLANVLAATAVAIEYGVPLERVVERAAQLKPARHRGEVLRLGREVTVIDDSYNASPTAMRLALGVLATTAVRGRRVAMLGEMFELGDRADEFHDAVGRAAAASGTALLVTVGGQAAERLGRAAVGAGMPREHVRHFAHSDAAADAVPSLVRDGDLVLVKGSRGVRMDRVVERLESELG